MIYTQMGNEITIQSYEPSSQIVTAERKTDLAQREYSISQLRADGGIEEIMNAIHALPPDCRNGYMSPLWKDHEEITLSQDFSKNRIKDSRRRTKARPIK